MNLNYHDIMKAQGKADALDLRSRAAGMDGTGIIAEESKAPNFDPEKDYSGWPEGAPVQDEGQVWTLITPHNAASYEGRPATLRALWGLCHTKDPARAKEWVAPYGTSGMYMTGECCVDGGVVCSISLPDGQHRTSSNRSPAGVGGGRGIKSPLHMVQGKGIQI